MLSRLSRSVASESQLWSRHPWSRPAGCICHNLPVILLVVVGGYSQFELETCMRVLWQT